MGTTHQLISMWLFEASFSNTIGENFSFSSRSNCICFEFPKVFDMLCTTKNLIKEEFIDFDYESQKFYSLNLELVQEDHGLVIGIFPEYHKVFVYNTYGGYGIPKYKIHDIDSFRILWKNITKKILNYDDASTLSDSDNDFIVNDYTSELTGIYDVHSDHYFIGVRGYVWDLRQNDFTPKDFSNFILQQLIDNKTQEIFPEIVNVYRMISKNIPKIFQSKSVVFLKNYLYDFIYWNIVCSKINTFNDNAVKITDNSSIRKNIDNIDFYNLCTELFSPIYQELNIKDMQPHKFYLCKLNNMWVLIYWDLYVYVLTVNKFYYTTWINGLTYEEFLNESFLHKLTGTTNINFSSENEHDSMINDEKITSTIIYMCNSPDINKFLSKICINIPNEHSLNLVDQIIFFMTA